MRAHMHVVITHPQSLRLVLCAGGHGKGNSGTVFDYDYDTTLTSYALDRNDPNYDPDDDVLSQVMETSSWC